MPKRRTQDVVNVVMTDHYIQRRPPMGDLVAKMPEREPGRYRGQVVPYYPLPLPALYRAVAQGLPGLAAEVEKQKPARPEFYIELGQAWLLAGNRASAVRAFDEAVKREPDSPVALLNLGSALSGKRAVEVLNHGVKVAPGDALLWYQLGLDTESIAALEKAVAADPDLVEAQTVLGALRAGSGNMSGTEAALRNALRVNPDFPDAAGNLGHLLAARGDLPQAAYYFARAVRLKGDDAETRVNYAVTLAGLNRFEEAQLQIEAAVKADPKSAEAHNFFGTLLARKGQADAALREFLEAVRLRPDFALAHLNAAAILEAKGDAAGAREHRARAR